MFLPFVFFCIIAHFFQTQGFYSHCFLCLDSSPPFLPWPLPCSSSGYLVTSSVTSPGFLIWIKSLLLFTLKLLCLYYHLLLFTIVSPTTRFLLLKNKSQWNINRSMWTSSMMFGFTMALNIQPGDNILNERMKYCWCEHYLDGQNNALWNI